MKVQKEDLRRCWQNKVQPKIKIIFNIPNYIERKWNFRNKILMDPP